MNPLAFVLIWCMSPLLFALVALPRIFPSVMSDIYDVIIIHMTEKWYAAVLARLPKGARVLDVGIGTATALVGRKGQNATVVVEKAF